MCPWPRSRSQSGAAARCTHWRPRCLSPLTGRSTLRKGPRASTTRRPERSGSRAAVRNSRAQAMTPETRRRKRRATCTAAEAVGRVTADPTIGVAADLAVADLIDWSMARRRDCSSGRRRRIGAVPGPAPACQPWRLLERRTRAFVQTSLSGLRSRLAGTTRDTASTGGRPILAELIRRGGPPRR